MNMEVLNSKGSKKRKSSSVEEIVYKDDTPVVTTKHEKKTKKEKMEGDEKVDGPVSLNRMEKKKKRKGLDKERHVADPDAVKPQARNLSEVHAVSHSSLSSTGLPDIHVAVFSDLSSADSSVREAAAETLVKELQEVQKAHEKLGQKRINEGGLQLEAEKDDGLTNCASSLRYAIRRLIRGVSSSRECARQGFALGLTMVVSKIPAVKVDSLMKLIADILDVTSSMKGQEARDCLLGRLFAYGALVRSGRIVQEWISDNSTSCVKDFVGQLISLASKKQYLREPAVWVVLDLVEKLPVEAVGGHVLEAPGMQEWFESATDVGNPDALLLALKMREKISMDNETLSKLLPSPFTPNKLFTVDHLSSLISCFKESTFCQPRVHSVWPVLVNFILPDLAKQDEDVSLSSSSSKRHKKNRKCNSSEEENEKNLRCFCDVVIDGCLLSSSHDRKHLAFDVLLLLLPRLPTSCVHIVLSDKLVHCLMDVLSTSDSWLYKVAQYFLKELSIWVGNDDERRVAVIMALQKDSGRFDCITRTHTVKGLVSEMNTGSGCMLFIQNLMSMFVDEGQIADEPSDQSQTTDENSEHGSLEDKDSVGISGNIDFLKNWVIDSLPRVLKNLRTDFEARLRVQKEIIKFLAVQGLFSASLGTEVTSFELQEKFKWPKAATSSSICRMCIEQLQLLLAGAQKGEASWSSLNPLEMSDLGSYFMHFLGTLCNIPSVSLFRPLSDEDERAFKSLQAMEARLSREERNHAPGITANKVRALRHLLIQLLLQVLLRAGEFSEAASELILCCKKAFPFLESSEEDDELDNNETPELMDVLVDTLLSLLPQSSAPTCFSVEQVFRFFCDDITDAGLLQMLRVIKKDLKPGRHQIMQNDDDDDDDEDFLGIEEAEEEIEEADAADSGDGDGHADDSEVLPKIEATGKELPDSDDSDGGMDDDAMFRMDSYLARIFKERKNSTGSETAHSQLLLFKLRVLSLLEIYLHRNPGKAQVLTVHSCLVQAFVNCHMAEGGDQVGQRIGGILQKKILKAKEYPRGEEIHLSNLESMLEKNMKLASRSRHKMITSVAQNSVFWILKIIHARNFPQPKLGRVLEIFKNAIADYFDSKKCRLKSGFIKEVFHRHAWIAQQIFGFLLEKCGTAKSEYRQVEALVLVDCILKSCMPSKGAGGDKDNSNTYRFFKAHLSLICDLIRQLLVKLPEKQSRRAEVRRFCARTLQEVSVLKLNKSFVKALKPDAYTACESHLGDLFLPFKRPAN